ncbi:MFS transporter [Acinetobacter oleivorans]|uniref:MFS transporter n=1 Tax=Acinetobacter oleivorans TaxID=1148157 RepID=UPI0011A11261|nr:MFS transporter [Acinetobacter oleivorans]
MINTKMRFYLFQSGIVLGYLSLRLVTFSTSWNFFLIEDSFNKMIVFSAILALFEGFTTFVTSQVSSGREQRTIYLTILFQATISLILAILFIFLENVYFLIILICVASIILFDSIREPLADSTIPQLIKLSEIGNAIRIRRIFGSISRIIGPIFAATSTSYLGVSTTLFIAFFILIAAFFLCQSALKNTNINIESAKNKYNPLYIFISSLKLSIEKTMLSVNLFIGIISASVLFVLIPKFSTLFNNKQDAAIIVGISDTMFGIGVLLGAFYLTKKIENHFGVYYSILISISTIIFSTIFLTLGIIHLIFISSFLFGIALINLNISLSTFRLVLYPDSIRTKLISNVIFISCIGQAAGALLTLYIVNTFGFYSMLNFLTLSSILYFTYFIISSTEFKKLLSLTNDDLKNNYSYKYENLMIRRK